MAAEPFERLCIDLGGVVANILFRGEIRKEFTDGAANDFMNAVARPCFDERHIDALDRVKEIVQNDWGIVLLIAKTLDEELESSGHEAEPIYSHESCLGENSLGPLFHEEATNVQANAVGPGVWDELLKVLQS